MDRSSSRLGTAFPVENAPFRDGVACMLEAGGRGVRFVKRLTLAAVARLPCKEGCGLLVSGGTVPQNWR